MPRPSSMGGRDNRTHPPFPPLAVITRRRGGEHFAYLRTHVGFPCARGRNDLFVLWWNGRLREGGRERVFAGRPMGGSQGKLLRRNPLAILKTFGSIKKARDKPSQVSESFITQKGFKYGIYMSKRDPWIHEEESWGKGGLSVNQSQAKRGGKK